MVLHPAQVLLQAALGLAAFVAMLLAVWLLVRAMHPRRRRTRVRVRGTTLAMQTAVDRPGRFWGGWLPFLVAALLGAGVFAGRHAVLAAYPAGDPTPPLTQAQWTTVRGIGGEGLAVARLPPRDGSTPHAGTPTLLLTHGWGADHRDWAWLIASLPPQLPVVVWDLPGLGRSAPNPDGDYAIATMAADLERVLAGTGGGPVVLVGHSVGGMLNLEFVRRFGDQLGRQVRGIVQVDTTFTNPLATKAHAERSLALQAPVFEPALTVVSAASPLVHGLGWFAYHSGLAHLQLAMQSFAGAQTREQLDEMARYAMRSSPNVVARGVKSMMRWDASEVLPRIHVPVLVICGDEDTTTLPSASDRMQREIPGAQRVSVSPAAHLGPVEQHRRYAQAIAAFVQGLPTR